MTRKMKQLALGLALAALAVPGVSWAAGVVNATTQGGCALHCPFCG